MIGVTSEGGPISHSPLRGAVKDTQEDPLFGTTKDEVVLNTQWGNDEIRMEILEE